MYDESSGCLASTVAIDSFTFAGRQAVNFIIIYPVICNIGCLKNRIQSAYFILFICYYCLRYTRRLCDFLAD